MDQQKIRDYKYIRNTLPKPSSPSLTSELTVGSGVTNLLPEVSEINVLNGKWRKDEGTNTISKGVLTTIVSLKYNTPYKLQVFNQSWAKSFVSSGKIEKVDEWRRNKESVSFTGDFYFYIIRPDEHTPYNNFNIRLTGLSANLNLPNICSWYSPAKPKVFLFETTKNWIIDDNGIIVGEDSSPIHVLGVEASKNPVNSEKDDNEDWIVSNEIIKEFLSNTSPQLSIEDDGRKLKVTFDEEIADEYKNSILKKLYLIIHRDTLVNQPREYSTQRYADSGRKRRRYDVNKQNGILRIINANTKQKYDDVIRGELRKLAGFKINPFIKYDNNNPPVFNSNDSIPYRQPEDRSFSFSKAAFLGHNREYGTKLVKNSKIKYTSISFSWGIRENGKTIQVSQNSIPVIINRGNLDSFRYNEEKLEIKNPHDNLFFYEWNEKIDYPYENAIYLTSQIKRESDE